MHPNNKDSGMELDGLMGIAHPLLKKPPANWGRAFFCSSVQGGRGGQRTNNAPVQPMHE